MTFSKHNWNQLSESSKRELKKRQAYEQGYQDALNEQAGVGGGMGMSTTAPKMPPSGGGMPGRKMGAGQSGQLRTGIRVPYPPDQLPKGTTHVEIDGSGNVYATFKFGDSYITMLIGTGYQAGPPATYIPEIVG